MPSTARRAPNVSAARTRKPSQFRRLRRLPGAELLRRGLGVFADGTAPTSPVAIFCVATKRAWRRSEAGSDGDVVDLGDPSARSARSVPSRFAQIASLTIPSGDRIVHQSVSWKRTSAGAPNHDLLPMRARHSPALIASRRFGSIGSVDVVECVLHRASGEDGTIILSCAAGENAHHAEQEDETVKSPASRSQAAAPVSFALKMRAKSGVGEVWRTAGLTLTPLVPKGRHGRGYHWSAYNKAEACSKGDRLSNRSQRR